LTKSGTPKGNIVQISRADQSITKYNQEQYRLQQVRAETKRSQDYAKIVAERNFERVVADRASQKLRSDQTKGRNIDIEC
jgi:hypothetical protein